MGNYLPINFAEVPVEIANLNNVANKDALKERQDYIERNIKNDFFQEISDYLLENSNSFLYADLGHLCLILIQEVEILYGKNKNNPLLVFQLEQILGQAKFLFVNKDSIANQELQNELNNVRELIQFVSDQQSYHLKKLGIALILIALTLLLSSIVLFSMSALGGGIGLVIGISLIIAGVIGWWISGQKGLALAANNLMDSFDKVKETLDYYYQSIAPILQGDDQEHIEQALVKQLNLGFPPCLLKGALAWAKHRYEKDNFPNPQLDSYNNFFTMIADICYVSHSDSDWLLVHRVVQDQDQDPQDNELQFLRPNDRFFRQKIQRHSSLLLWKKLPQISPALSYFNQIIAPLLENNDNKTRCIEGLENLIKQGYSAQDLKSALKWAHMRYLAGEALNPEDPETKDNFFERIDTICGLATQNELIIKEIVCN